ncbi:MAG: helix-turn-helix transcriptional regulator [Labilithrix sp.]|nr:helix-turn-helix transcriptional regulator [Labilithrix sp.]
MKRYTMKERSMAKSRGDIRALSAIDVVESAYRLDGAETEWLDRVVACARPDLDTGLGVYAFTSAGDAPNIQSSPVFVQHGLDGGFAQLLADLDSRGAGPAYDRLRARLISCGGLEQFFGARSDVVVTYRSLMKPQSIDDGFFVFAQDDEGTVVNLAAPSRRTVTPPPRVRGIWAKVGLHLAAALRLRRKLAHDTVRDALLDPSGTMHDAGVSVKDDPTARDVLSRAVRAMEQARSTKMRAEPEHALQLWRGLVAGEWSLVEHWESDGRRYLAAYRNRSELRDPRALNPTERSLLKYVALGATNKQIAYALGLPTGTVSSSIMQILRKLRLSRRVDLASLLDPARMDRLDIRVAGRELGVLTMDTGPRGRIAEALSTAELDVATHVARGWTNARIAEERQVSPHTVANQLRRIFAKLEIKSRAQLARLVASPEEKSDVVPRSSRE